MNDRPAPGDAGLDPVGLMEVALRRADADAGGGWLARVDSLACVAQISFPQLPDTAALLVGRLGIAPARCETTPYPGGDAPVRLLHEAANRIAAGEIRVAAVAGGEALRTAASRGADPTRAAAASRVPEWRARYGLVAPTDIYPLYENATRAAWGQTLLQAQRESGEIWARFSEVAANNSDAWLRRRVSADEVVTASPENRPIAFPYTKLMVANAAVNQGAGFIVTSAEAALEAGIPESRLVYVGLGAAAREAEDPLARDRYDRSASLAVSIRRTMALNGLCAADLDYAELYSCFPCIPKMARRVLDWPIERPASVVGGLTFGGGPIGNYMSHAVARMVQALRVRGRHGLLFANGGYATYSHALVLSRQPGGGLPQDFDFQAEADAARGEAPVLLERYEGRAKVETYTVFFGRDGAPRGGVIVARTPAGERFLAAVPECGFLMEGEPVGSTGVVRISDGLCVWSRE